jgi:hypothetical protein
MMQAKSLIVCLALTLSACASMSRPSALTATVTGIAAGRASLPAERVYVLRTASGRVYTISQVIDNPPKIGDAVFIEPADKSGMLIIGPAK